MVVIVGAPREPPKGVLRLLGVGSSARVYEIAIGRERLAAKVFNCGCCERELELARWAQQRNLGPRVYAALGDAIVMEKMTLSLADSALPFSEAQRLWQDAFSLLEQGDFSRGANWLCGDDLKCENVMARGRGEPARILDWDPRHWQALPVPPDDGRALNRILLVLNTMFRDLGALSLWPDEQRSFALALAALAAQRSELLLRFASCFDRLLRRGPYHYARLRAQSKRARAELFAQRLAALAHEGASTQPAERFLRNLVAAYQRRRLRRAS
jgi:hypothetical protein